MNSQGAVAQTAQRDLAAELDEDDGTFPESWRPRPGDKIVGTVTKYTTGEGRSTSGTRGHLGHGTT